MALAHARIKEPSLWNVTESQVQDGARYLNRRLHAELLVTASESSERSGVLSRVHNKLQIERIIERQLARHSSVDLCGLCTATC